MSGITDRALNIAADMRAPSGASAPTLWQRLSGTGTTADANVAALTVDCAATLTVGPSVAVRYDFGSSEAAAIAACGATSPTLLAGGRLDWVVSSRDTFIAIEAFDGSSAFEGHVWTSSGERAAT